MGDRPAGTLTSAVTFGGLAAAEALGKNVARNDIEIYRATVYPPLK